MCIRVSRQVVLLLQLTLREKSIFGIKVCVCDYLSQCFSWLVPAELRSSFLPQLDFRLLLLLLPLSHHNLFVFVAAFQTVQLVLIAVDVGLPSATWLDALRYLPHGVLVQVVLKVVEESDDFLVLLELVRSADGRSWSFEVFKFSVIYNRTYPFLKRFMLTTMWYCCQRFEKLIDPSWSKSGFPMCTKVRSCSTRPLWRENNRRWNKLLPIERSKILLTCTVYRVGWFHPEPDGRPENWNSNRSGRSTPSNPRWSSCATPIWKGVCIPYRKIQKNKTGNTYRLIGAESSADSNARYEL